MEREEVDSLAKAGGVQAMETRMAAVACLFRLRVKERRISHVWRACFASWLKERLILHV